MPLPSTPSTLLSVRNAIYTQLAAELAPSKRLSTVQAVGYSWLNAVKMFPYVSIYAAGRDEKVEAVRRKRSTNHFVIGMAYKSTVSLEDAYTQLYGLMDDGYGNGLEAILRDPAFFTWGGTCNWSEIKGVRYYDNVDATKMSSQNAFITYATVQYDTTQLLDWQGTFQ